MQPEGIKGVTQKLRDKLAILERETQFASLKPNRPNHWVSIVISGVLTVGIGVFSYLSWRANSQEWAEHSWYFMFYVALFLTQLNEYRSQRKTFRMYSVACELIEYYRKREEQKV